jgi:DNA-binding transcriptional ArsR family regulator
MPHRAEERSRIMERLSGADEPLTAEQVAVATSMEPQRALSHLNRLRRQGLVETRRGRRWVLSGTGRGS